MKPWGLTAFIVLGLAGCSGKPATQTAALACPAADFPGFLEAFMANEAVQRQFVRLPLTSLTTAKGGDEHGGGEDELISLQKNLPAENLPKPLIPTRAEQAGKGVSLNIYDAETDYPWVRMANSGANIRMVYRFEKTPECWQMTVMQDQVLRP